MHPTRNYLRPALVGFAALLAFGCDESTAPVTPTTGAIVISVFTSYSSIVNLDPDGYALTIDDRRDLAVATDAYLTIDSLPFGKHVIHLRGLASNCYANEDLSRQIDLNPKRAAASISFVVTCSGDGDEGGWWDL